MEGRRKPSKQFDLSEQNKRVNDGIDATLTPGSEENPRRETQDNSRNAEKK